MLFNLINTNNINLRRHCSSLRFSHSYFLVRQDKTKVTKLIPFLYKVLLFFNASIFFIFFFVLSFTIGSRKYCNRVQFLLENLVSWGCLVYEYLSSGKFWFRSDRKCAFPDGFLNWKFFLEAVLERSVVDFPLMYLSTSLYGLTTISISKTVSRFKKIVLTEK